MDCIVREWDYQNIMKTIECALRTAEDESQTYAYRVGALEAAIKLIKQDIEMDKDIIGTTGVIWIKQDIINRFNTNYDRDPTGEELEDILENYIDLIDCGETTAIEYGWDHIDDALYDYEKDNEEKFNDIQE